MITQARLKELFEYDLEIGIFTNLCDRGRAIKGETAGWISDKGYVKTKIQGRHYYMHKLAWLYVYGIYPDEIDHKDGNKSNNVITNLRLATRTQNCANADQPIGASGLRGAQLNSSKSKWQAMIQHGGQKYYLGKYDTKEEAAAVYRRAVEDMYGEFAFHKRPSTHNEGAI